MQGHFLRHERRSRHDQPRLTAKHQKTIAAQSQTKQSRANHENENEHNDNVGPHILQTIATVGRN
jgi:hypothetical protein